MGIVNNSGKSLWGAYRFQSSAYTLQCAHHQQYILCTLAEHASCTIYCKQVADIEFADELYTNFMSVDIKIHTFEMTFYDLCLEVSHLASRVGLYLRLGVLNHHHAILIVGVGYSKGCFWQHVKECLLGIAIVLECLVVVEVVASKVGENTTSKLQTADTLLSYRMA